MAELLKLYSWGSNSQGRTGIGATSGSQSVPVQVGSETNWDKISSGGGHTLALRGGELFSWGANSSGELGVGGTSQRTTPTQVGTDSDWDFISAGISFSLAIKGGELYGWGRNTEYQLGLGNSASVGVPTRIGSDTDWLEVDAGDNFAFGIKTNGTLWAWGTKTSGALASGIINQLQTPTQVGTDTDWASVSCGNFHGIALKTNGTLWAWGANASGELGVGDTSPRTTPTQVGSDTNWVLAVSSHYRHCLAIKSNGTLYSWGYNNDGQLGLGDTTQRNSPVQVGVAIDWSKVSASGSHSLAIKTDGSLYAWGANGSAQLGLGDTSPRDTPTRVGTDSNWVTIAGLGSTLTNSSFAVKSLQEVTVTPPTSTWNLMGGIPKVVKSVRLALPCPTVSFITYNPSTHTGINVTVPTVKTLNFFNTAPEIVIGTGVVPPASIYNLLAGTPLISGGASRALPIKGLNFNSYVLQVSSGASAFLPPQEFSYSSFIPEVKLGTSFVTPEAEINLTALIPKLLTSVIIKPELATYNLIGIPPINEVYLQVPTTVFEFQSFTPKVFKLQYVNTCSMKNIPLTHMEDSKKLEADAYVELFQIRLNTNPTNTLYLKVNSDITWQGKTYEGTGIKLEGVGSYADDEVARPQLSIVNPAGVFSHLVDQGFLENAKVTRLRVLKQHITEDLPIFRTQQWYIKRVSSLTKSMIVLELRDMLDGQHFLTPGRMFIPPEFSMVSL